MERAEKDIQNYWKMNVYDYFNARASAGLSNTGQLGRSLQIKIRVTGMEFFMVPMHNPRTKSWVFQNANYVWRNVILSFLNAAMGMGFERDYDYGDLLRNGFGSSPRGRYSYKYDCKIEPGFHPGYDASTRWVPWMEDFGGTAKQILRHMMMDELEKAESSQKEDGRWILTYDNRWYC